jgi:hypothetical protein
VPQSVEGWEVWDVLERCAGQLRVGPGGPIGLDFGAVFALGAALGYDRAGLAELLPSAESGLMRGFAKLRSQQNDDQP